MVKITNIQIVVLIILFLLPALCSSAQDAQEKLDCHVVSFEMEQFSTTAQERRYEKIDKNGDRYAIIKIKDKDGKANLSGFTFNFGTLNSEVKPHGDELWVYVQRNAKTVTIRHPDYKTIEKYDLNTTIQPGKTYVMLLTLDNIVTNIKRDVKKQILQFKVSPANEKAVVKVKKEDKGEYELWGAVDGAGTIDRMLDFGVYDYKVVASDYLKSSGRIKLSDSRTKHVEDVILKPNFGFLEVDGNNGATGAEIYVDDVKIGTVPYSDTSTRWKCGNHQITIKNGDLYKPFYSTFIITQGDITKISPRLESDFAQTTISVDGNAEILIDGQFKGTGSWTGPLKTGEYTIICRKVNHRESSRMITIKPDVSETFVIPSPIPITGSVYISSRPSGATISIDGETKGTTPSLLQDVLIGSHKVQLKLANHKTEDHDVVIKENETLDLDITLSDMAHMTIDSKPSNAILYIDNHKVGTTPYSADMASGDYDILIKKRKYKNYSQRVHLDSSTPTKSIKLNRQYLFPNSFYIQPTFQIGSFMAAGGQIGGYISNGNMEASYLYGMDESEMVYWNAALSDAKPCGYTYRASAIGVKLGYGIIIGTRMRITPQAGTEIVQLSSSNSYNLDTSFDASETYAVSSSISAKFECAITNNFGFYLSPEYTFAVKKGNYYTDMESVSDKIKGFVTGANVKLGVSLFF
ncbi:MAG: PEGA domain-containing protein [Bacteroidaceae bacterium]|nr:PEGA domain-containing protein [Bacteroidaceae bacterium]